jgi:hypothetical protein
MTKQKGKCTAVKMRVPIASSDGRALLKILGIHRPRKYDADVLVIEAGTEFEGDPERWVKRTVIEE